MEEEEEEEEALGSQQCRALTAVRRNILGYFHTVLGVGLGSLG
jgi:hypothetical protein